jgi:hypothetical protein
MRVLLNLSDLCVAFGQIPVEMGEIYAGLLRGVTHTVAVHSPQVDAKDVMNRLYLPSQSAALATWAAHTGIPPETVQSFRTGRTPPRERRIYRMPQHLQPTEPRTAAAPIAGVAPRSRIAARTRRTTCCGPFETVW